MPASEERESGRDVRSDPFSTLAGDHPPDGRPLPRGRRHQPVRGLTGTSRSSTGTRTGKSTAIERLDRILEAEGDSPDRYKLSKQADVGMLFYLLPREELQESLAGLGYAFGDERMERTVEYDRARTSHGSTLSRVVFASTIHHMDCEAGCELFLEVLRSDVDDLQGGTTAEGIHVGAMAGSLGIVFRHYAGVDLSPGGFALDLSIPGRFRRIAFRVQWLGRWLDLDVTRERLALRADADALEAIPVRVRNETWKVGPGETVELPLRGGTPCD